MEMNSFNKMPELEQKTFQKRQVAHKARISDILNSAFVKDELSAGYVKLNGINVSRVNIIANVVYKSEQSPNSTSAIIDDGTGKILLRAFENDYIFSKIDVGDFILAIGKIREFNNERYIMPEILKKIDDLGWMKVRKAELKNTNVIENEKPEEVSKAAAADTPHNTDENIYLLIKNLDKGDGAAVDEIIKISNSAGTEETINKLLANGDVFEIKPGMLKVLE